MKRTNKRTVAAATRGQRRTSTGRKGGGQANKAVTTMLDEARQLQRMAKTMIANCTKLQTMMRRLEGRTTTTGTRRKWGRGTGGGSGTTTAQRRAA